MTLDPSTGQWRSSNTLLHSRGHHASWRVEAGVILLGGAAQGEDTERRTSEIVRPDGSGEETFALKFPTGFVFSTRFKPSYDIGSLACTIPDPSTSTVIVTGGVFTPTRRRVYRWADQSEGSTVVT